jgi:hypothetical protein
VITVTADTRAVVMVNIWTIRSFFLNIILVVFGYVFPTLSSAKAVLAKDDEALREWLTYWAVFSIFTFLETIFDLLIWRLPFYAELKIVCVLWLSMPGFQGAFRVYNYVIRPYFEQYEDDIDELVDRVSDRIQAKASTHVQNILWQLLISPKDGLLPEMMRLFGFFQKFVSDEDQVREVSDSKAMSAHMLQDFKVMLIEGVYLEASTTNDDDSYCVVKMVLHEHRGHFITVEPVEKEAMAPLKLSIINIFSIIESEEDERDIVIEHDKCGDLFLRAPEVMESEAVVRGLQILLINNRSMHCRILKKAFSIIIAHRRGYESLKKAFQKLSLPR